MVRNFKTNNDEINLIELIQTIWQGKWKIAVVVVISFISAISYQSTLTNNFTATTEIRPISTLAVKEYIILNNFISSVDTNFNFHKITKSKLLDLYVDILKEKSVFEDAIRKFNLLDTSQYNNEKEYSEAIIKFASSIKIISPSDKKNSEFYHTINFTYVDFKKWQNVLIYVNKLANQNVKKILVEDFNLLLSFSKQLKEYEIKKLRQIRDYNLEDLTIKINNLLDDYDRNTFDRLELLKEQSEIAVELGIENSSMSTELINNSENFKMLNIKTNNPSYFRGFKALNKEIDLIRNRQNKEAFVKGLFSLEKTKRAIEQDKSIERIERDKSLDLLKEIMLSSPLGDNDDFYAASVNIFSTKSKYKHTNNNKILLLATVFGLIAGIFYLLIYNAFKSHRVSRKKTN